MLDPMREQAAQIKELRKLRGEIIALRDVRYTDPAAVDAFEKEVVATTDAVSNKTVDFLLGEDSLKSYAASIDTQEAALSKIAKVTEADEVATALDQAATDAVKQWVYTPTLLNGVPVPVIMTVTVNFRLS